MMTAHLIRYWLVRRPQPDVVKIYGADSHVSELKRSNGQSWSDMARSIEALEPERLEVFDAVGNLIRATRCDDDESDVDTTAQTVEAVEARAKAAIAGSAERTLSEFARHLAEAYRFSCETAFNALVDIANSRAAEVVALQRAVENQNRTIIAMQEQRLDERLAEVETKAAEADPLESMINSFQRGRAEGAAAKRPTNGKGQI